MSRTARKAFRVEVAGPEAEGAEIGARIPPRPGRLVAGGVVPDLAEQPGRHRGAEAFGDLAAFAPAAVPVAPRRDRRVDQHDDDDHHLQDRDRPRGPAEDLPADQRDPADQHRDRGEHETGDIGAAEDLGVADRGRVGEAVGRREGAEVRRRLRIRGGPRRARRTGRGRPPASRGSAGRGRSAACGGARSAPASPALPAAS